MLAAAPYWRPAHTLIETHTLTQVQGAVIGPSYMSSIQGMLRARQSAFAAASAGKSKAAGSVWGGGRGKRGKRRARQWMDSDSDNDREGEDGAAGAGAAAGGEGAALMLAAVPQGQSYHCWRRKRQRPGSAPPSIRVSRGITVSPTRPFAASSSASLHSPRLSPSPSPDHGAGADMAATATSNISNPLRRPLPRSATATACGAGGGGSGGAGSDRGARAATNLFGTTCSSSDGTGQAHFVPALILHGTT